MKTQPTIAILAALFFVAAFFFGAGVLPAQAQNEVTSAWDALTAARNVLDQTPRRIPFEQRFIPAGFDSGDLETGVASFNLPDCVRWDYQEPDPRSYLLCGNQAWTWNEGEDSGRHLKLDENESGVFELWLSPLAQLRAKYDAELIPINDGYRAIRVTPKADATFGKAEIVIDRRSGLPIRFQYSDLEDSNTVFEFAEAEIIDDTTAFRPPDYQWIDDQR